MSKKRIFTLLLGVAALAAIVVLSIVLKDSRRMECAECEGAGVIEVTYSEGGTEYTVSADCDACEGGTVAAESNYYATFMSLVPALLAIGLALITKEVYSSLFIGILVGSLFAGNYNIVSAFDNLNAPGIIQAVADTAGIFVFLVVLGILVALINKTGGSAAFGRWASEHVHTKIGATICTFILGVLIFIDDYFNCLTVGSVMRPVTDSKKMSRAKLAYLIDATAAPVCMIAPISSWAAAVSKYTSDYSGNISSFTLFCKAIPYNFYSLLTFVFILAITFMKFDFGPMRKHEKNAEKGDLFTYGKEVISEDEKAPNPKGRVCDLLIPIAFLIVACALTLLYVGGFFTSGSEYYHDMAGAFGDTDATIGLPLGGIVVLLFTVIYLMCRKLINFQDAMAAVPQGFIAMVPSILILTLATALKNMTSLLGSSVFVKEAIGNAGGLAGLLPAIIFLVACCIAFATGTSWGTFGILIPIVLEILGGDETLMIIGMSACLAGAVCGDHCSPISDTTIMSSAGARCEHVNHVSTQLPYAITVAAVSFICFIIAGFVKNCFVPLAVGIVLIFGTLIVLKKLIEKKESAEAKV